MADALGALSGARVRLWRYDGRTLRKFGAAPDPGFTPPIPLTAGLVPTPTGSVWLAPVPDATGFWIEVGDLPEARAAELAPQLGGVVGAFLTAERETAGVVEELTGVYKEIDLLYAISEILGHTTRLEEAAPTIVHEVAEVVGARRASIMVYDEETKLLRTVAARGFSADGLHPVEADDASSVAARVFREKRIIVFDPADPLAQNPGSTTHGTTRARPF